MIFTYVYILNMTIAIANKYNFVDMQIYHEQWDT